MLFYWAAIILGGLLLVALVLLVGRYFSLWLQANISGVRTRLIALVLMSLRNIDPQVIIRCQVMAYQAGLEHISRDAIEAQYLAGGDVNRVMLAIIAAHRSGLDLDWNTAAAIDLAGRDILDAVRVSVNPRVIDCPDPQGGHGDTLDGVARDGIQLQVRVRVTVRTNLSQLVGGATEATVIARVGESIVSAIGSCDSYKEALADPLIISRQVMERGLDSQTAFAIVSINIADIDVGENIGAKLQIDQANADIRIAGALAETRRASAIAHEQEMTAQRRLNQSRLVLAEAGIPLALAGAIRGGRLLRAGQSPIGAWPVVHRNN